MSRINEVCYRIHEVISTEPVDEEQLELLLTAYLEAYQEEEHNNWVGWVEGFVSYLWRTRRIDWIKRLYKNVFEGPNERYRFCSAIKLVESFVNNADRNDDPASFYLIEKNLVWMSRNTDFHRLLWARIEAPR